MSNAVDERALITGALQRDPAALDRLVERLMPIVRARVFRLLRRTRRKIDSAELDDLVQEVWLRLFAEGGKRLLSYDPERGASLEAFVGMLAEREAAMLQRSGRAQKRGGHLRAVALDEAAGIAGAEPTPEEYAKANQLASRLGEHLSSTLPEVGQLVLRYAFKDEVEPPAVARILGVDVQVVYNWQHKIRRLARAFLAL